MSYRIIFILILALSTGCKPRTSQGFNALSETEKNARWLDAQGYSITRPQEYLARADSALAAERNAENYLEMSYAQWFSGHTSASLAYADSALAIVGDDDPIMKSRIHTRRAMAYGLLGDRNKERAAYKAVVNLGIDEDVRDAMESIALSYFLEGKYKESLANMPDSLSQEGQTCKKLIQEYMKEGQPVDSNYILVKHLWKPLLIARFLTQSYSETEAVSWAKGYQMANQRDTVWREELRTFGTARRFMAVYDFYGAWHGEYRTSPSHYLRQTEWRLLQYDTTAVVFDNYQDKVLHLRELYKDILDYDAKTEEDLNIQSALAKDFELFYEHIQK